MGDVNLHHVVKLGLQVFSTVKLVVSPFPALAFGGESLSLAHSQGEVDDN